MKRLPLLVLASIALTLAACGDGGGGGDEDAFCEALETLSDEVADGSLGDEDDIEDALDAANAAVESAEEGDQLDAARAVAEDIGDADVDDADDTAEAVQDELGDFADDCGIDEDEFAVAPTTTTTTTEPPSTTTTEASTTTTTDGTGTTGGSIPPGDDILIEAREDVPAGIAPEFAALADLCFQGDAPSCDDLFAQTPVDSIDEAYGLTCGGRIPEDSAPGQCAALIVAPTAPPTDIVDQATARRCFDGEMLACDELFNAAAEGSTDRAYGALCGFRVQNTQEFCVPIFGDQAFF